MAEYEWKNMATGELVVTRSPNKPPDSSGYWRRAYSIHFGKVKGAGDSPGGYVRHLPREE